jgi:glycine C-acetyltransferase
MYGKMKQDLATDLQNIEQAGLYKRERIIMTPQGATIRVKSGQEVLNFCANNYLGLSSHPKVLEAAHAALDEWGYGLSSVRFICGTQGVHKQLEAKMSEFLGTDDTILFSSCFDANGSAFEPLLGKDDAIITDGLNHASVIDGIRLCKAQRYIYKHDDMADLEQGLQEMAHCRYRMVSTDGVFSMDGDIARLQAVCDLAEKYDALVMVDDSHSTGFMGKTGRGTHEHCGVMGRVDLITTTFGKALGGSSGGCISARQEIVDMMRQKGRPYLFSNTLSPVVAAGTLAVLNMLSDTTELRDKLERNTMYFRENMTAAGFDIRPGVHPIAPIMLGKFDNDAALSQKFANALLDEGIYVIGFFFPVVPRGAARIRVQISAGHDIEHIDRAIGAFTKCGKDLGIID